MYTQLVRLDEMRKRKAAPHSPTVGNRRWLKRRSWHVSSERDSSHKDFSQEEAALQLEDLVRTRKRYACDDFGLSTANTVKHFYNSCGWHNVSRSAKSCKWGRTVF